MMKTLHFDFLFSLQVCHCFPHQQFLHHGLHTDQKISTIIIIRLAYLWQDLLLSFYPVAVIMHKYTVTKHTDLCFPISISMITEQLNNHTSSLTIELLTEGKKRLWSACPQISWSTSIFESLKYIWKVELETLFLIHVHSLFSLVICKREFFLLTLCLLEPNTPSNRQPFSTTEGHLFKATQTTRLSVISFVWRHIYVRPVCLSVYVVVQFYPWFKFYFLLFQTNYHVINHTLPYPKTKENKIWTKDKIEPQHIYI